MPNLEELERVIKENLHENHINANVNAVKYKSVMFVSIKEKPRKQNMRMTPTYFCLLKTDKFFFCSNRVVIKFHISAINNVLNYRKSKLIKLTGKDLPSLIRLLRNRQKAFDEDQFMADPIRFKATFPILTLVLIHLDSYPVELGYIVVRRVVI